MADVKKHFKDRTMIRDLRTVAFRDGSFDSIIEKLNKSSKHFVIIPGLIDVHVHFREPGFSYKETIATGSMAAAHGGYTLVCPMPNLEPVPDSLEDLQKELELIEKEAVIQLIPYGAVTVDEKGETLSDIEGMAPYVCAFSDDGKGIQSDEMMLEGMRRCKAAGKILAAHCEVDSLVNGGYIHDGCYAREHGHRGICSESEWKEVERDVRLAAQTGCTYHVCHVSTGQSVAIVREAKKNGWNVSCEVGPHYLVLDDRDLQEDGRFKMNPPIRSMEDRKALIEGIKDGTIEMIATDHAPHSPEEKSRGLEGSPFGIVGLETAFPVLYTKLVKEDVITLEKLIELMNVNPKKRFGLDNKDDFAIFETDTPYTVDPEKFYSMGHATPFAGWEVYGNCVLTVHDGKAVYTNEEYIG